MKEQSEAPSVADGTKREDDVGELGDRLTDTSTFLTPKTAVAVLLALTYWVTVFVLPTPGKQVGQTGTRIVVPEWVPVSVIVVAGVVLGLLIIGVWRKKFDKVVTLCVVGFFFLISLLFVSAFNEWIPYTMQIKFAIGVGGTAIASFVCGIVVYNTLRVAASLPIVILLIGLATFPAGFAAGDDLRGQIILWMGGILGIATVTEGITQAVRIRGSADVRSEVVKASPTDGEAIARMGRALTSDIANIGGDLSAPMDAPAANPGSTARPSGQ